METAAEIAPCTSYRVSALTLPEIFPREDGAAFIREKGDDDE
jgi:hypothetical protein